MSIRKTQISLYIIVLIQKTAEYFQCDKFEAIVIK